MSNTLIEHTLYSTRIYTLSQNTLIEQSPVGRTIQIIEVLMISNESVYPYWWWLKVSGERCRSGEKVILLYSTSIRKNL